MYYRNSKNIKYAQKPSKDKKFVVGSNLYSKVEGKNKTKRVSQKERNRTYRKEKNKGPSIYIEFKCISNYTIYRLKNKKN